MSTAGARGARQGVVVAKGCPAAAFRRRALPAGDAPTHAVAAVRACWYAWRRAQCLRASPGEPSRTCSTPHISPCISACFSRCSLVAAGIANVCGSGQAAASGAGRGAAAGRPRAPVRHAARRPLPAVPRPHARPLPVSAAGGARSVGAAAAHLRDVPNEHRDEVAHSVQRVGRCGAHLQGRRNGGRRMSPRASAPPRSRAHAAVLAAP